LLVAHLVGAFAGGDIEGEFLKRESTKLGIVRELNLDLFYALREDVWGVREFEKFRNV
jgi:hypothetical protein